MLEFVKPCLGIGLHDVRKLLDLVFDLAERNNVYGFLL